MGEPMRKQSSFAVTDPRLAESIVYAEVLRCAEHNIEMSTCDDLADLLGGCAVSTTVAALNRLQAQGKIRIKRYQRSRQIFIVENGKATAAPRNTAPHWRDRPRNIPSVPIHIVAQKSQDIAMFIQSEARRLGKLPADFIADLVYIGAVQYQAEMDEAA